METRPPGRATGAYIDSSNWRNAWSGIWRAPPGDGDGWPAARRIFEGLGVHDGHITGRNSIEEKSGSARSSRTPPFQYSSRRQRMEVCANFSPREGYSASVALRPQPNKPPAALLYAALAGSASMLFNPKQEPKAAGPTFVTPAGIRISGRLTHPANAWPPIARRPLGKEMLVRSGIWKKARPPIAVTGRPSTSYLE